MDNKAKFQGEITVNPPLNEFERSYLLAFHKTPHVIYVDGPLHVTSDDNETFAPTEDEYYSVIDRENFDTSQPGLRSFWDINDEGTGMLNEEPENAVMAGEWLDYIIKSLFSDKAKSYVGMHHTGDRRFDRFSFNHVFNGVIHGYGENPDDIWRITVKDNVVTTQKATVTYE